jgi:spore coat protein SA
VLIEAMASGVQVIACDVGGVRDVVRHQHNGILIHSRRHTAREFARWIAMLSHHAALREKIIEGGLRTVQDAFNWTTVAGQYRALLS